MGTDELRAAFLMQQVMVQDETYYRVRIGPFKYRRSAVLYRQDFESKERMVTFIVDPPKVNVKLRAEDE